MSEIETKSKFYRGGRAFFAFMCAAVITCMAVASLLVTVYYPPDYTETPFISFEYSLLTALLTCVLLFIIFAFDRAGLLECVTTRYLTCFMAAFTLIFGILWVVFAKDTPGSDMAIVSVNAENMLNGNFELLRPLAYFSQFPYQLGMSTVLLPFIFVFGDNYIIAFQIANVFFTCVTFYYTAHITDSIFNDKKASVLVRVLLMMCLPVILCCTLMYGTIISPMFCTVALYYALKASSGKKRYYVFTVILMALAYLCKPNALIFGIGIAIYLIFDAVSAKRILPVITAVCVFAAMTLSASGMISIYERVSDYELDSAMPKIAWIAMGLQEGPLGPGWFNEYTDSIYIANGGDAEAITAVAVSSIKDSLINFVRSPGYTLRFFTEKAVLQWCEPTYSGFWVSAPDIVHGENRDLRVIITLLYFGQLHSIAVGFMDIVQLLFYSSTAFCIIRCFKKLSIKQLTPAIIIIGGVAYHLISESKCLYALPYYILFVPYAAYGICTLCADANAKISKIKNSKAKNAE